MKANQSSVSHSTFIQFIYSTFFGPESFFFLIKVNFQCVRKKNVWTSLLLLHTCEQQSGYLNGCSLHMKYYIEIKIQNQNKPQTNNIIAEQQCFLNESVGFCCCCCWLKFYEAEKNWLSYFEGMGESNCGYKVDTW